MRGRDSSSVVKSIHLIPLRTALRDTPLPCEPPTFEIFALMRASIRDGKLAGPRIRKRPTFTPTGARLRCFHSARRLPRASVWGVGLGVASFILPEISMFCLEFDFVPLLLQELLGSGCQLFQGLFEFVVLRDLRETWDFPNQLFDFAIKRLVWVWVQS